MRKFLLVVLGVVAVLLLAGGAAIAWLAARVDEDQLRAILAQRLADALGREVTIAGHLDLRLGLSPSISVRGVAVANASWGTAPRMLELGQVDATLELLPLLAKRVSVGELKLRDVRAWLETDAAGRGNWELGGAGGGALPWFYLVEAERVRIALREGATGTTRELAVERASAAVDRRDGLVSLTLVGALDGDCLEDRMKRILETRSMPGRRRVFLSFGAAVFALALLGRGAAAVAVQVAPEPGPDDMVGTWKGVWKDGEFAGQPAADLAIKLGPDGPLIELTLYKYEMGSPRPPLTILE